MPGSQPNSYRQSLQAALARVRPLAAETVPFAETPGRVLAEDVRAERDDPPADLSGMDGYALRAADTAGAAETLPLRFAYNEVLGAGHAPRHALPPGGAMRIMTGAMLPAGADAVVKQEDTQARGEGAFAIVRPLQPGENVQARGSRLRQGEPVLRAGDVLRPQAHGMLAVLGRAQVAVHRRPRVGLLALGDELVPVGQPLAAGRIHVSNLYLLHALLARGGAEPVTLGILGDDEGAIAEALLNALRGPAACDVVLTLGGSMRGDFDFVGRVLARLGAEPLFDHTRMIPARSTHCAASGGRLIFGLPGTPAASWVAFEALVRPVLDVLAGRGGTARPQVPARLTHPVHSRRGSTHFVLAWLHLPPHGDPTATPLREGPHGGLPPMLLANALLICDEEQAGLDAGAIVPATWLDA